MSALRKISQCEILFSHAHIYCCKPAQGAIGTNVYRIRYDVDVMKECSGYDEVMTRNPCRYDVKVMSNEVLFSLMRRPDEATDGPYQ